MKRFEYHITVYPADLFRDLIYFCSSTGECRPDQIPKDQTQVLTRLLNEQGLEGWEIVQLSFSKEGAVALWKHGL